MSFETESDVKGSNVKIVDDECILTTYISKYPQHLKPEISSEKKLSQPQILCKGDNWVLEKSYFLLARANNIIL